MDPAYTRQYEEFELKHWWHRARRQLIISNLRRHAPNRSRWLDIGCGTGVLLNAFTDVPGKMGLEMDGASVARAREKNLDVHQTDASWDFSPWGQFDLVTACDVIEHVQDDLAAVAEVHRTLFSGGVFLLTVPALQSLWSAHDVRNHHFRRYNRGQLLRLFPPTQWNVLRATYFCTALLPPIWLYRQFTRALHGTDPAKVRDDTKLGNPLTDAMFHAIFHTECRLVQTINMPTGSSLLLVASKR